MKRTPDDVELFTDKLRGHANVESFESVRTELGDYAYLVGFSDDCTQTGIDSILSSMRRFLSDEVGYEAKSVLQVYDDRVSDDIPNLSNVGRYERILIFNFN